MLSHPILVEAIETHFVPLCIYNNVKGKDQKILKRFKEPAWNNPVVRYVNADGKDTIPRKDRIWSLSGTASRMAVALCAVSAEHKATAPAYIQCLLEENVKTKKRATFAMHCFWEGEVHLGGLHGVTSTRAAWLDKKEVVVVEYDERVISYDKLLEKAREMKCASTVFAHDQRQLEAAKRVVGKNAVLSNEKARDAKLSDRLYYLRKSIWNAVPATRLQRVRMNVALAKKKDPGRYLSPNQIAMAERVRKAGFVAVQGVEPPPDPMFLDVYAAKLTKLLARVEAEKAGKPVRNPVRKTVRKPARKNG